MLSHLKLSSLPRRRLLSTFLLALFLLLLLSSSLVYHPASSTYLRSTLSSSPLYPLPSELLPPLRIYPPSSAACSPELGCNYTAMRVSHSTLFDLHDGRIVDQDLSTYENDGGIFNPALLRMPAGSQYGFLGAARGPSKVIFENDKLTMPRTLVAWFANLEDDSSLVQAGSAVVLDLASQSSPGCEFPWDSTPGPEDPRLLWSPPSSSSPAQVPILILGMDTARTENCRSMGVMDLRTLWPELKEELDRLDGGVPSAGDGEWAEGEGLKLDGGVGLERGNEAWFQGIGGREKNWAAFYSPFENHPHKHTLPLPTFHYSVTPNQELLLPSPFQNPSSSSPLAYNFYTPPNHTNPSLSSHMSTDTGGDSDVPPSELLGKCVKRVLDTDVRPPGFKVGDHQASPFYPLTLSSRSQVEEIDNSTTVLVGLVHSKSMLFDDDQTWLYDQYLVVLNASAPYTPLGVSHVIPFSGLTPHKFYFSQSLTFIPVSPSSSPPSPPPSASSSNLNTWRRPSLSLPSTSPSSAIPADTPTRLSLSHGFLDDDVLVGLGEGDGAMGVVRMSVKALLGGVEDCSKTDRLEKLYRFS